MTLFPISLLFLKFNRGRLQRDSKTPLSLIFLALLLSCAAFGGNIALNPLTIGYFSAYVAVIMAFFFMTNNKVRFVRYLYWAIDQTSMLHEWRWAKRQTRFLAKLFKRMKKQPVCVLAKTDEVCLCLARLCPCLDLIQPFIDPQSFPHDQLCLQERTDILRKACALLREY